MHYFYWHKYVKAWELDTGRRVYRLYINAHIHTVVTFRFFNYYLYAFLQFGEGGFLDKITLEGRCSYKESNFKFYVHTAMLLMVIVTFW